ncbi:hypothetical protein HAX54_001589, partial [Datura stramonium]|nr:hypothetical protein [Datura stramonium]
GMGSMVPKVFTRGLKRFSSFGVSRIKMAIRHSGQRPLLRISHDDPESAATKI